MQKVHYDLDLIEAGIRKMYANAPSDAISDNPAAADIFKRSVEIEVQATRFFLGEIMAGTNPPDLLKSFEAVIVNLVMNHTAHFDGPDIDQLAILDVFMPNIIEAIDTASINRQTDGFSAHGIAVSPVMAGNA